MTHDDSFLTLTSLSDRPGNCFDIKVHLLPMCSCIAIKTASSSSDRLEVQMTISAYLQKTINRGKTEDASPVHSPLFKLGFRWLIYLSLHCLPDLPGKNSAILLHFLPYSDRFSLKIASSVGVHEPLPFT